MYLVTYYSNDVGEKEDVHVVEDFDAGVDHVFSKLGRSKSYRIEAEMDGNIPILRIHEGDLVVAAVEPVSFEAPAQNTDVVDACNALVAGDIGPMVQLFGGKPAVEPVKALTDKQVREAHDISLGFWNKLSNPERQQLRNEAARWGTNSTKTAESRAS